jgi:hypothetical protein
MRIQLRLLLSLVLATSCTHVLSAPPEVSLRLQVDQTSGHPVVTVVIANSGSVPVALSDTFGFGRSSWLGLDILDSSGERVHYPEEVDIFERPPHTCLAPTQEVRWNVDLLDWMPRVGGREWSAVGSFGFELPPGDYRIRAGYWPSSRADRKCPQLLDPVFSDWVEFSIATP